MGSTCGTCEEELGTSGTCKECQQFLMSESTKDMSEEKAARSAEQLEKLLDDPPWYAKFAPDLLLARARLMGSMVSDYFTGDYKELPWPSIAAIAAAIVYVVSPIDLIPDFIIPVGWTDDIVVVALVFEALGIDLAKYAKAKGLDTKELGL